MVAMNRIYQMKQTVKCVMHSYIKYISLDIKHRLFDVKRNVFYTTKKILHEKLEYISFLINIAINIDIT